MLVITPDRYRPTELCPTAVEALDQGRALVDAGLREAVAALDEPVRRMVEYHFGWTTVDGLTVSAGGGKILRALVVLMAGRAVCGSVDPAVPGAVAIELAHNSTLLQDDVMDGDRMRRHRPATWTVFGKSEAVLAGDALIVHALKRLLLVPDIGVRAAHVLADTYQRLVVGQAQDLSFERRTDVSIEQCLQMAGDKSAALIAASAAIGGILAGADEPTRTALASFGWHTGLAFQIVDDILGVWGDPDVTGKPVGSDIYARKKSIPVVYALSLPERPVHLAEFYADHHRPTRSDVDRVTNDLDECGAEAWARTSAQRHLAMAGDALASTPLRPAEQQDLLRLAHLALDRVN